MERLYTSNVSIGNGNMKCPIGKSIFAVNLPLKLFRVTVVYGLPIHSLKKMFVPHAIEFEQNRTVHTTRNFELLDKKTGVF